MRNELLDRSLATIKQSQIRIGEALNRPPLLSYAWVSDKGNWAVIAVRLVIWLSKDKTLAHVAVAPKVTVLMPVVE